MGSERVSIARVDGNAARVAGTRSPRRPSDQRKSDEVGASEWSRGDASDIDAQNREVEWTFGKSDIEGKTAREAASELGKGRVSNGREHMSQRGQRESFNRESDLTPASAEIQERFDAH